MKTKEIIEKANLTNGFDKKKQEVFFNLLASELSAAYVSYNVKDSERHFDAAIKTLRSKWDAISIKIPYGLSEGVWKSFYTKWVAPMKEEFCPTWKKRNDEWVRKCEERSRHKQEKKLHNRQ